MSEHPSITLLPGERSLGAKMLIFSAEDDFERLEIRPRKQKQGEELPFTLIPNQEPAEGVIGALPLLKAGKFSAVAWTKDGKRSSEEGFTVRPRFKNQETQLSIALGDRQPAYLRFREHTLWATLIALSQIAERQDSKAIVDQEAGMITFGAFPKPSEACETTTLFPGSLFLSEEGNLVLSTRLHLKVKAWPIASTVQGMASIEGALAEPQNELAAKIEFDTHKV